MTYRWIEHTAELELELDADSPEQLFADALSAFAELLGGADAAGEPITKELAVESRDRPLLFADWLEELVFAAETEGFVPERLDAIDLDDRSLHTTVSGRICSPPPLVKAVTYHRLELGCENGHWHARVVLDV